MSLCYWQLLLMAPRPLAETSPRPWTCGGLGTHWMVALPWVRAGNRCPSLPTARSLAQLLSESVYLF